VTRAGALAVALLTIGCASGPWGERRAVSDARAHGRVYVPRLFEPVIPGSVYPNRRFPVPARSRPGVVLVVPPRLFVRAAAPLLERGLVVLRLEGSSPDLSAAVELLAGLPECAGAPIGLEMVAVEREADLRVVPPPRAIAFVGAAPARTPAPGTRVLVLRAWSGTAAPPPAGAAVERWYRAPERFRASDVVPAEAWRDAAEWLAEALLRAGS
jgi:hypothetical protein